MKKIMNYFFINLISSSRVRGKNDDSLILIKFEMTAPPVSIRCLVLFDNIRSRKRKTILPKTYINL